MYMKVTNSRGELAMVDSTARMCHCAGENADPVTINFETLQNVDTVFPPCAPSDADSRMFSIARSALSCTAPSVSPRDDSERALFREVWNEVVQMKGEFKNIREGFAFSKELGAWADGFMVGEKMGYMFVIQFRTKCSNADGDIVPFSCLSKHAYCNNDVREGLILSVMAASGELAHKSVGVGVSICWNGSKLVRELREFSRCDDAALMIALRHRTSWYKEWKDGLPF